MKVKKLIGKTINDFKLLDRYPVTLESGKITHRIKVQCVRCGRIFERSYGKDLNHIRCECRRKYDYSKPRKSNRTFEWNGEKYTKAEFCRIHNLNYDVFINKIRKGVPTDKAIEESKKKKETRKKIEWNGKQYSMPEFCRTYDLDYNAFSYRIRNGMSIEDAMEKTNAYRSIEWEGKQYTKAKFCRTHNLNYDMFCRRIKKGMPLEKAMEESKVEKKTLYHFIDWKGKRYTQTDFCKMHDINPATFHSRIKSGMSIEDAIKKEFECTCEICGKKFKYKRPGKKTCSKTCQNRKLTGKGPYKEEKKRTCVVCGNKFMSIRDDAKTCSEKCRSDLARIERNRRYKHLKEIGEFDESATLPNVFNRFKGICQSCGDQLTFDEDWLSGKYPSIDHVIPLSKGGTHTWDNLQLLCRDCNCKKSNKTEIFA